MKYKILEKFIMGKQGKLDLCEDGIFHNEHYIAIIDGVTDKSGILFDGKKGGKLIKDEIIDFLDNVEDSFSANDFFKSLNKHVQRRYKEFGLYEKICENVNNRPGASLIIYSFYRKEFWIIGDCHMILDGEYYSFDKEIDLINSKTRSLVNNLYIKEGFSLKDIENNDYGRKFIQPILDKQQHFANTKGKYSYTVYDAFTEFNGIIINKEFKELILATDGYPELKRTLKENEEFIEKIKKEDRLCINIYLGTKGISNNDESFDDRAFLKIII